MPTAAETRRRNAETFLATAPEDRVVLIEITGDGALHEHLLQKAQNTLAFFPGEWTCSWQDLTHARAYPVDMHASEAAARAIIDLQHKE